MQVVSLYDHPSFMLGSLVWEETNGWNPTDAFPSAYQTTKGILLCWTWCIPAWNTLAFRELFPSLPEAQQCWRDLNPIPTEPTKGENNGTRT